MTKMMTIELGKGMTMDIDTDALCAHEAAKEKGLRLGFQNIFKDCHASATRDKFESDELWKAGSKALVDKCYAAYLAGEVRGANTVVRVPSDPIGAEAMRLARVAVYTAAKDDAKVAAWAKAFTLPNTNATERKAIVDEAIKRNAAKPDVIAAATATVAARKALVIDVSAL